MSRFVSSAEPIDAVAVAAADADAVAVAAADDDAHADAVAEPNKRKAEAVVTDTGDGRRQRTGSDDPEGARAIRNAEGVRAILTACFADIVGAPVADVVNEADPEADDRRPVTPPWPTEDHVVNAPVADVVGEADRWPTVADVVGEDETVKSETESDTE